MVDLKICQIRTLVLMVYEMALYQCIVKHSAHYQGKTILLYWLSPPEIYIYISYGCVSFMPLYHILLLS